MRHIRNRLAALAACLALLAGAATGCRPQEPSSAPEGALTVTVLDVGKADCILLSCQGETMLIDTGTRESAGTMLAFLQEQGITRLDVLLLTHPDKDHIGGVPDLLEAVAPAQIIQADAEKDSDTYARYEEAVRDKGLSPLRLREELELELGGASVRLIPGKETSYDQSNDASILAEVTIGSRRFLFAGDAERERIQEYLDTGPEPVDFLKVPHHGGEEKNSALFFYTLSPDYAVITCSEAEPPDDEVLAALEMVGAEVFLTSRGTVTAVSDGEMLEVRQ